MNRVDLVVHGLIRRVSSRNRTIQNLDQEDASPHFFAIHAAVAEILEASGVRVFLDRLMSLYAKRTDSSLADLRCWTKLEFLVKMKD